MVLFGWLDKMALPALTEIILSFFTIQMLLIFFLITVYQNYINGKIIYLLSKQEGLIELDPLKLSFKKISDRGIVAMHQNNDVNAYLYSDGF